MIPSPPQMTLEEFDVWALLPDNVATEYEYICGEVVLRAVSDYWASVVTSHLSAQMFMHVQEHRVGHVMGAKIGFRLGNERYVPIVSYTDTSRWIKIHEVCYMPFMPTLAVESVSSLRPDKYLRRKIHNYLHYGTTVWVVHTKEEEIEIYRPHQPVRVLRGDDMLSEQPELPEFSIALSTLFEKD